MTVVTSQWGSVEMIIGSKHDPQATKLAHGLASPPRRMRGGANLR